MVTFSNRDYAGPFSSKYEEDEAAQGNRGPQAQAMASQAVASRGLRERGMVDTSRFGTNRDLLGRDQFSTPQQPNENLPPNPLLMDMRPISATNFGEDAPISAEGRDTFFTRMAGGSGILPNLPKPSGIADLLPQFGQARKRAQQDLAMGLGSLFTFNPDDRLQKLTELGFSGPAAVDFINRTEDNLRQQRLRDALYGDYTGQGRNEPLSIAEQILEETDSDVLPITTSIIASNRMTQ